MRCREFACQSSWWKFRNVAELYGDKMKKITKYSLNINIVRREHYSFPALFMKPKKILWNCNVFANFWLNYNLRRVPHSLSINKQKYCLSHRRMYIVHIMYSHYLQRQTNLLIHRGYPFLRPYCIYFYMLSVYIDSAVICARNSLRTNL